MNVPWTPSELHFLKITAPYENVGHGPGKEREVADMVLKNHF
jgi:hypothetical protein